MFVLKALMSVFAVNSMVDAVPVVFKESTPNGESIVAISSSDPNVEKYFAQQFATRSGFTQLNDDEQLRPFNNLPQRPDGAVHSSYSIAVPGKAVSGAGRSFASASSGPFLPLFTFPIGPEGFGFNDFGLKGWVQNVESFYNPNFPGNSQVSSATAVSDNGHVYGSVNGVSFDNRAKSADTYDNNAKKAENFGSSDKTIPFDKKPKNIATFDDDKEYKKY
ncbi:hypothetical protein PYW07_006907 [Mythimna separata]|uniref:Uncharacterized protein n=1 Tax=Mythimna separata TaxID=271217 RepID=A0AAD7Z0Y8_MYTSE|nr:hypothetical protein PYW07_006907 [Mythimna separata]